MAYMELIVNRKGPYRHIAIGILEQLDDKSLYNCRLVNKAFKALIDQVGWCYARQILRKKNSKKGHNDSVLKVNQS